MSALGLVLYYSLEIEQKQLTSIVGWALIFQVISLFLPRASQSFVHFRGVKIVRHGYLV